MLAPQDTQVLSEAIPNGGAPQSQPGDGTAEAPAVVLGGWSRGVRHRTHYPFLPPRSVACTGEAAGPGEMLIPWP